MVLKHPNIPDPVTVIREGTWLTLKALEGNSQPLEGTEEVVTGSDRMEEFREHRRDFGRYQHRTLSSGRDEDTEKGSRKRFFALPSVERLRRVLRSSRELIQGFGRKVQEDLPKALREPPKGLRRGSGRHSEDHWAELAVRSWLVPWEDLRQESWQAIRQGLGKNRGRRSGRDWRPSLVTVVHSETSPSSVGEVGKGICKIFGKSS